MDVRAVRVLLCCLVVLGGLCTSAGLAPLVDGGAGFERGSTAAADPGLAATTDAETGADIDTGSTSGTAADAHVASALQDDEPSLSGYHDINVEIALYGNGSATWTVEYAYRLDDGNETVDWESLQSDVENRPDAYLESFEADREKTLADAENATGRNMTMSNFAVETDQSSDPSEYGYIRFTFDWGAFSHVEVNQFIEAGDALEGFTMDERTKLVITWPEEYRNASVEPAPDETRETTVIWDGDETREFVDGEPRVELIQTGGEPLESPDEDREEVPLSWLVGTGLAVLVALALGWWWATRRYGNEDGDSGTVTDERPADPPAAAEQPRNVDDSAEKMEPPLELLSNEERVMRLLEERGGRIKQQEVVAELDWTEAKTSQVVSGLREADQIEVFRIGRENVLAIPEDAGSVGTGEDELDASGEP